MQLCEESIEKGDRKEGNMCNISAIAQIQYEKMGHDRSSSLSLVLEDIAARFILTCPDEEFESFERLFFQIEVISSFYLIN